MSAAAVYEIVITVIFLVAVLIMYFVSRRNIAERNLAKTQEELQSDKIITEVHALPDDKLLEYIESRDTTKKPKV